jgi:hypothetical protein
MITLFKQKLFHSAEVFERYADMNDFENKKLPIREFFI